MNEPVKLKNSGLDLNLPTSASPPDRLFPQAAETDFCCFENKYAGQRCTIVGRGPTEFDYAALGDSQDPVFFINDAVSLENYAAGETFFFAHDPQALAWLNGAIQSTAVIPMDGKIFRNHPGAPLRHRGKIVFYHWIEENRERLLLMSRPQIAQLRQLYTHTGTIHSLLHFVWFCGFKRVQLIGCDGITDNRTLDPKFHTADGYDPRLTNLSQSSAGPSYPAIFHAQQLLLQLFDFEAAYLGTPRQART